MIPGKILKYLPKNAQAELLRWKLSGEEIAEIRLRRNLPMSVTMKSGENLRLSHECNGGEMEECLLNCCGGSLHSHSETLKNGFVSLPDGMRAGVCGRAYEEGGRILSVSDISSVSIRLPCTARVSVTPILTRLEQSDFSEGMLLVSLPGVGKTTALRELAIRLSSSPYLRRVALVDSRQELFRPELFRGCLCDVLSGYPKGKGIEAAVRGLNPQFLICDEIGGKEESEAILASFCAGVPLIASCHSASVGGALAKPQIKRLCEAGVFGSVCLLERDKTLSFRFYRTNGEVFR